MTRGQTVDGSTGKWEIVIGMEVHCQVTSESKLFSGAATAFGAEPNSQVSLVDAAMPEFKRMHEMSVDHAHEEIQLLAVDFSSMLFETIAPFKKFGVNMTWIESFPIPNSGGDRDPSYLFFIDVEGHVEEPSLQKALELARKKCERLDILGSYPKSACIES